MTAPHVSAESQAPPPQMVVVRHRLSTRIWHWINAGTLLIMLMSGLMIFNAHPRLYWGQYGANPDPAWLEIGHTGAAGFVRIGSLTFASTGLFGTFTDVHGVVQTQAFPGWMTIPGDYSLADARLWHLAFAWVLAVALAAYLLWSLANGHLRRDVHITRAEWHPRHLWEDVKHHAALRFPTGLDALRYSVLQKLAYASVLFGLIPLAILTGLTMSPGINAAMPFLLDLFGGRQSARSLHFLAAAGLVLFFLVHMAMVLLSGPINQIRGMTIGRFRLPPDRAAKERDNG
jgi:thiosulfate reductase cytochrome b subunit